MRRREQEDAELLDEYWSTLPHPTAAQPAELDPQVALVTRRLVSALKPPEPEAAFAERLRRRLELQEPTVIASCAAQVSRWRPAWPLRRMVAVAAALLLAIGLVGGGVYAALSVFPSPGPPPPPASLEDLRLVAGGVDKSAGVSGRKVGYAFIVENPSEDLAAEGATYRVTAYGLRGAVLATDSGSIPVILPGQRIGVGGFLTLASGEAVDRLGIEIDTGRLTEVEPQPTLEVGDVEYQPDGQSPKATGIVRNPYQKDVQRVRVSAVAYSAEGIIIGGGGIVVRSIPAGGQEAVAVPVTTSQPPATVELYAGLGAVSIDGSSSPSSGGVASPSPALSTQCRPGPGLIRTRCDRRPSSSSPASTMW